MHTLAWIAWVSMVMTVALSTSNPLYLAVVLLAVVLVGVVAPKTGQAVAGFRALLVFGSVMLLISLAIAMINGSYGEHVLFHVPGPDAPSWLGGLAFGGPVTAEALVAAAIRGFSILCVLLAFGVFNGAVSPYRALRTTPAALFHAGLVVTVGLTLLPASVDDVRRLREMRALRGAPSGWSSLPGLIVPAVIGGLERSMRLAEAMEARGFAAAPANSGWPRLVGALSAPLLLGAAGCWYYYAELRWLGAVLGIVGFAALATWVVAAARGRHTTSLRSEPLGRLDQALIALSLGVIVAVSGGRAAGLVDLGYNPFAGLEAPPFSLAGGLIALACAWPACVILISPGGRTATEPPAMTFDGEAVPL